MKNLSIACLSLALAVACGSAFAQSCGTPTDLSTTNSFTGNTCSGTNEIGTYCGVASSAQKEQIYAFNLAAAHTATAINLTNTQGAGFTPSLVLFQGTCANGDNCAANSVGTAGGNTSLNISAVATGAYLLAVTSDPNAAATDCGTYGLAYTGTLPVKLEKFSVN